MVNIFLMRHGQTPWNKNSKVQGKAATELTEYGEEEVVEISKSILSGIEFDKIYTSDIYRTMQTTDIVTEHIEVEKVITDSRLREQDFGILQGLPNEKYKKRLQELDKYEFTDKEELSEVRKRVVECIEEIAQTEEGNILVVTHTGPTVQLLGDIYDVGFIDANSVFDVTTSQIIKLKAENGSIEVVDIFIPERKRSGEHLTMDDITELKG